MLIKPTKIEKKQSKNGDTYLLISDGKDLYSVWNQSLFNYFFEGAEIDVELEIKGKFKNIVGINEGTEKPTFKSSVQYPSKKPNTNPDWDSINQNKEDNMEWLNAKNNAALILSSWISNNIHFKEAMGNFEEVTREIYSIKNGK